jgi:hypothetical protein
MIGHHITEHARQKILKEIAIRAQKHVLDMTYNWYEYFSEYGYLLKLIYLAGASKYLSCRRSARTLRVFSLGSSTPKLTRSQSFSRPRLSLHRGKPLKCSLSLSSAPRISLLLSTPCFQSAGRRLVIWTRKASVERALLRPLHPYLDFLCLFAQLPHLPGTQALS